jgi:chromosome segregation ATPase
MSELMRRLITIDPRGSGRTTALAIAAKSINATLVCADEKQSRSVAKELGVKTVTLNNNVAGTKGPYIVDHFAVEVALFRAADQVSNLESRYNSLLAENERLRDFIQKYRYRLAPKESQPLVDELLGTNSPVDS